MTKFIQLHLLTAYPPSNPNRDDAGRPKTAQMGGVERLRISSQSLKRAWRTSDVFQSAMAGHMGVRTRLLGKEYVYDPMVAAGVDEKKAEADAIQIAGVFGKCEDKKYSLKQAVHVSPYEISQIGNLVKERIAYYAESSKGDDKISDKSLALLKNEQRSVDIAMFGRMLADKTEFNSEAACQVSHALGVSAVTVEDDFFTAVDDLNKDNNGAAHMNEQGFASSLCYTYICISKDLLVQNLDGNEELANKAISALLECALTIAPSGKQNSFANRVYASYAMAEVGTQQPRSLAVAFFKPVSGTDQVTEAINRLEKQRADFNAVYGLSDEKSYIMNASMGNGSLKELLDFVQQ